MLSYELCKELKESGYQQKEGDYFYYVQEYSSDWDYDTDGVVYTKEKIELIYVDCDHEEYGGKHETLCYCPTLSELIEACGDRFAALLKFDEFLVARADNPCDECYMGEPEGKGDTFEEAVARLWLALNKKDEPSFNDDHLNG